jgi:hypothetical protein
MIIHVAHNNKQYMRKHSTRNNTLIHDKSSIVHCCGVVDDYTMIECDIISKWSMLIRLASMTCRGTTSACGTLIGCHPNDFKIVYVGQR